MQELLSTPVYWLFLLACASSDYLKLVPLLFLHIMNLERNPLEFLALGIGDFFLVLVTSLDDIVLLSAGVSAFLIFVWSRIILDAQTFQPVRKWPLPFFLSLSLGLVILHPIEQYILQTYVHSLAMLLALRYCQNNKPHLTLGYSLYVLSDCLLLLSLSHRFWGDWIFVRLLYWSGLTLVYVN